MARNFLGDSIFNRMPLHSSDVPKMLLGHCGGKILAGAVCLLVAVCLHAPVALAQHGGGHFGGGNFGGVGARASASRGAGAPAAKTGSIFHIFHRTTGGASGSALAAAPITTPVTLTSSGFLLRPISSPASAPQSVFYVPVFFGSPFFYGFYGGFNSFGLGCDPFWGVGCFYSPFYGSGYGFGGYYGGYYGALGGGYTGYGAASSAYSSANGGDPSATPATQSYVPSTVPSHRADLVELFFKDGTVYDVTDYWVGEGQLHFLTLDESGQKTVERVAPLDTLDLQTTTDENNSHGFKFQLRNQSMEQYFREHPEVVPKGVDPEAPQI